jgi:hypothetical protein
MSVDVRNEHEVMFRHMYIYLTYLNLSRSGPVTGRALSVKPAGVKPETLGPSVLSTSFANTYVGIFSKCMDGRRYLGMYICT